jgi:hypothetical protein
MVRILLGIQTLLSVTNYMMVSGDSGLKFLTTDAGFDNVYSYKIAESERHIFMYTLNATDTSISVSSRYQINVMKTLVCS